MGGNILHVDSPFEVVLGHFLDGLSAVDRVGADLILKFFVLLEVTE